MFHLLHCVAGAVVKNGGKFLLNLIPGGAALADIAADAWDNWRKQRDAAALRAEVQTLAQASAEQVRAEALAAVAAEAAGQPKELQEALTNYLTQVPAMIRRSLRRPSDPTGTSILPDQHFRGGEDLLPFLPPRPPRFKAGDMVPGLDWELVELLGVGGFGEVWKARHHYLTSEPLVALKFCLDDSETAGKALKNEAGVLDRVRRQGRQDGIVTLRQTHFGTRPPCLEYEYVAGGDLASLIQELKQKGALTPTLATRLLLSLAETVAFAHRADPPIVHCDLKPANVLVERTAKGEIVLRITDFGIGGLAAGHAIQRARTGATSRPEMVTDALRGAHTPFYAPPDQIARRRGQAPDPRDDVHALGMIWYQLVTGDLGLPALPSDWHDELQDRGLSAELTHLLAACIASRPERRPASAVDLAERLNRLLTPPIEQPPPSPPQPAAPPPGRGATPSAVKVAPKLVPLPAEVITNSLHMKLAWIPPGSAWLGGGGGTPGTQQITVPQGFYLGVYPVTQGEWQALMGNYPSWFSRTGGGKPQVAGMSDADILHLPVEEVSWNDAQKFLKKLNEREGHSGWLYRLPTDAEWEYACRGGPVSRELSAFHFYFDNPTDDLSSEFANFNGNHADGSAHTGNDLQRPSRVGLYPANALGLHDMHGNVMEWCDDHGGLARIFRGGSWLHEGLSCRASYRKKAERTDRNYYLGFRVAGLRLATKA